MLITLLALCLPAQAHPHVWVTVETTLLYEGGAFTGLKHKWTFDEFYSAMAIEGLDTNKDGKYDRKELAELAKVNVTSLKDFGYFTHPMLAGTPVKIADPRDYWLEHTDGILSLHFTVPFATPVLPEAKGLSFSVSDPSFFIAFALAKTEQPVRLSEGAPTGCSLKNGGPEEAREVSALGESLAAVGGFAISGATTISVDCPPPPPDPTGLLAAIFILGPNAVPPGFALRPPMETQQQILAAIFGPDVTPPSNSFRRPDAARKTILASIMGPEVVPSSIELQEPGPGISPKLEVASKVTRVKARAPKAKVANKFTRVKGKRKLVGRRGRAKLAAKSRCRSCAPAKRARLVRIPGRQ